MQPAPSILRQLAIMLYDALLMLALLGFATFLFILLFGDATQGWPHIALQLFLWIVAGVYFVYSWSRTGQTLAMKTWRVSYEIGYGVMCWQVWACFSLPQDLFGLG
jgi:uncharacterized RDD family membrane protein YckC